MTTTASAIAGPADFFTALREAKTNDDVLDLCRRHVLHGTPFVFKGNEDGYFGFRKRIADQFEVSFHEIYLTGSAKLGFRLSDGKLFDLDSDIDVAIVAPTLYERFLDAISKYQMALRASRRTVTERELKMYHQFLEYTAIGWMRPDLLPFSFDIGALKDKWFEFFRSISAGRSEVGNYSVSGGVFRSYSHLEKYQFHGLLERRTSLKVEAPR